MPFVFNATNQVHQVQARVDLPTIDVPPGHQLEITGHPDGIAALRDRMKHLIWDEGQLEGKPIAGKLEVPKPAEPEGAPK